MTDYFESKIGLAHLADSRDDFFEYRKDLIIQEKEKFSWLHEHFQIIESKIIRSQSEIKAFLDNLLREKVSSLIIHLPVWADPELCLNLVVLSDLPVVLVGNMNPSTSSLVGLLGSGGALDQCGIRHLRIFGPDDDANNSRLLSWINAGVCIQKLRGKKLGLFGGKSLGIFTAVVDPAQWMSIFGIGVEIIDQLEIVKMADLIPQNEVDKHIKWFESNIGKITYNSKFSHEKLELQMRSYIATQRLISSYGFDFVGVKCQPELSDGYVSQCVAHALCNSSIDVYGKKNPFVHACESDADGALSMEILKILSGGKSTALLDVRWLNLEEGVWTLANCGAMALDFFKSQKSTSGIEEMSMQGHVFGKGGGGALTGMVKEQEVSLMRLCRKDREYIMHFLLGEVISVNEEELNRTTSVFPQAFVKSKVGMEFIESFGSNHIHMVNGDYIQDLIYFCKLLNIKYCLWD